MEFLLMEFINFFGAAVFLVIMVPNIIYAVRHPEGFENSWHNRAVEILEQVGRYGCMAFMILIIPGLGYGFADRTLHTVYIVSDIVLLAAYCAVWAFCFNRISLFRSLALSVIPSLIFLASGILSNYWPLVLTSLIFAPCHILISVKNTLLCDILDS